MFTVTKRLEISAAHFLELPYESKYSNLHGHNWIIEVTVAAEYLDKDGMVVDFGLIKEAVMIMDHGNLNDFMSQPTAERIAEFIDIELTNKIHNKAQKEKRDEDEYPLPHVAAVKVQESEGNTACYIL